MAIFKSYLDKLKFDPKLNNSLQAAWLKNTRLVVLLVLGVIILGTFTALTLPRRVNPEVKIPIVIVSTVLPGASPEDIETLITDPLEDALTGADKLDTITSVSSSNVSLITMQFLTTQDGDKARTDVQSSVDTVTLPDSVQNPRVMLLDFEDQPIWTFSLTTKKDPGSLMRFATSLKKTLTDAKEVSRVDISGFETQEVTISLDPEKVSDYQLNPIVLSQAIKKLTASYPAGVVKTDTLSFSLTIDQSITTIEDLRNLRISTSGQIVKLGDIAKISEYPKEGASKSYIATKTSNPKQSLTFYVYKKGNANIDSTADKAEALVTEKLSHTNEGFEVTTLTNTGTMIKDQYTELFGDFAATLLLVFINLFLFLGLRQAALATFTTPLTFLSGIVVMSLFGLTINFISMFAFLLALGTSIDDTIVVISAMTTYFRTKKFTPTETGLLVWRDFIVPIWSTTITTVWAYAPLLLATGIIGEFIKSIPIVVSATMYSSTVFSVLVTLPLFVVILKPNIPRRVKILAAIIFLLIFNTAVFVFSPKTPLLILIVALANILVVLVYSLRARIGSYLGSHKKLGKVVESGVISTDNLGHTYKNTLMNILSAKHGIRTTLIVIFAFAVFAYALVPLGFVKNEFFPGSDEDTLYLNLELPQGTNSKAVERELVPIITELRTLPEVSSVTGDVGKSFSGQGFDSSGSNIGLITLNLLPKEKRSTSSIKLAQNLRDKYKNFAAGEITVQEASGGPPAGADLELKLSGEDLAKLNAYADKVIAYLKTDPGVTSVKKSVKPGTSKLVFTPDFDKLAEAGIGEDQLGLTLRTYATGFTLDKLTIEDEKQDIVFKMDRGEASPDELGSLMVPNQTGAVPLISLGTLSLKNSPTQITHDGGERTLSITAGVKPGFNLTDINANLESFATTKLNLDSGYTWKTGGVNEENNESVQSIFKAMLLSFVLILLTMVVQFKSFRQAAIILMLIPIAISGVFIIFGLTATPLSFPALIGVLALFGIVVTNAMFIVDKINVNRKQGMDIKHAIADAGESRLEPILLTSLTTILGLIPITISNPLWRGLGGAIISGLTFSGIIMLFFVPVAYYLLFKGEKNSSRD